MILKKASLLLQTRNRHITSIDNSRLAGFCDPGGPASKLEPTNFTGKTNVRPRRQAH